MKPTANAHHRFTWFTAKMTWSYTSLWVYTAYVSSIRSMYPFRKRCLKAMVFSSLNATTIWLLSPNRTSLKEKKRNSRRMKYLSPKETEACGSGSWLARMCKRFGRMSRRLMAWGLGDGLVDESAFLTSMRTWVKIPRSKEKSHVCQYSYRDMEVETEEYPKAHGPGTLMSGVNSRKQQTRLEGEDWCSTLSSGLHSKYELTFPCPDVHTHTPHIQRDSRQTDRETDGEREKGREGSHSHDQMCTHIHHAYREKSDRQMTDRDIQKDRRERGRQRERKCFHFLDNRLRKSKSYEQTKILDLVTQIVSISKTQNKSYIL